MLMDKRKKYIEADITTAFETTTAKVNVYPRLLHRVNLVQKFGWNILLVTSERDWHMLRFIKNYNNNRMQTAYLNPDTRTFLYNLINKRDKKKWGDTWDFKGGGSVTYDSLMDFEKAIRFTDMMLWHRSAENRMTRFQALEIY